MRLFPCFAVLSPRRKSSLSKQEAIHHREKEIIHHHEREDGSPRSLASGFDSQHHHQEENDQSLHSFQPHTGILQASSSPPPLGYNTFSTSSYSYDRSSPLPALRETPNRSAMHHTRRATGSPTSTTSRVSFSGSINDQRRSSVSHSLMKQMGAPTAYQSIDGGQELCSRVYTSDNVKMNKRRSSWLNQSYQA